MLFNIIASDELDVTNSSIEVTFYVQDKAGLSHNYQLQFAVIYGSATNITAIEVPTNLPTDYGVIFYYRIF